jgi:hypothetical protein
LGRNRTPVPTKAFPSKKLALRGVTVPRGVVASISAEEELEPSGIMSSLIKVPLGGVFVFSFEIMYELGPAAAVALML